MEALVQPGDSEFFYIWLVLVESVEYSQMVKNLIEPLTHTNTKDEKAERVWAIKKTEKKHERMKEKMKEKQ